MDVALRALETDEIAALRQSLHEQGVLAFSGQHLTREEHVELAQRFGAIDTFDTRTPNATQSPWAPREPGTPVVVERDEQGTPAPAWEPWRSDGSFKDPPVALSIRCAVAVDGDGGQTEFADLRAAYDALPVEMRTPLEALDVWHSAVYAKAAAGEIPLPVPDDPTSLPGARHPLVRVHPATQRRALFLGENACHVFGHEPAEGQRLLADLTAEACRPPHVFSHVWRAGDVVMWDARSVIHRTQAPGPSGRRVLRHISIVEQS